MIERFADQIGTFPDGKATQVNFSWLYHSRHVLGKSSALLP